jgi:hypothetical protein
MTKRKMVVGLIEPSQLEKDIIYVTLKKNNPEEIFMNITSNERLLFNFDTIAAENGDYIIEVSANDTLGNINTESVNITINNTGVTENATANGPSSILDGYLIYSIDGLAHNSNFSITLVNELADITGLSNNLIKLNITAEANGTSRVYFNVPVEVLENAGITAPYSDGDLYVYVDHGTGVQRLGQAYYNTTYNDDGIDYTRWYFETDDYSIFYIGILKTTSPGGSGGSSPTTILCTPNWVCGDWGECVNSDERRECLDMNNCGTNEGKPVEYRSCAITKPIIKEEEQFEKETDFVEQETTTTETTTGITEETTLVEESSTNWGLATFVGIIALVAIGLVTFFFMKKN